MDPHHGYQVDQSIKWTDFLKDCGKTVSSSKVKKNYIAKYQNKYIEWEGHVMRIDGNEFNYLHMAKILVVMNPRDSLPASKNIEGDENRTPDLILSFDVYSFERNRDVIEGLRRGDYIRFNATITHAAVFKAV